MLTKLFKRFRPAAPGDKFNTVTEEEHGIAREDISAAALSVITRLQRFGYAAFLVGGSVRDLLLHNHPKDFDVATNATPEQVKEVFRQARIIGRRFQIVHVRQGREIIEVTTFRGSHMDSLDSGNGEAEQSDHGVLLRDNVYTHDIVEDAIRRDFTVNALYYNPTTAEVLDFSTGIEDLKKRQIRILGDPESRYKEDPVRLLRAVRFAAKLGFSIEPATEKPIREHADYLDHVPPARRFEEVLKLFMNGSATATFTLLRDYGLLKYLFPATDHCMDKASERDRNLVTHALTNTDKRIRQGMRVTPAFLYAVFLWLPLRANMRPLIEESKMSVHEAMQSAAQGIISQQLSYTAIPKRFLIPMREIWTLQLRLPRRDGKKAQLLSEHPRFRAAYDFLLLREQSGENMNGLGGWWTRFQEASNEEKEKMVQEIPSSKPRRRKKRSSSAPSDES